ncbi:MAG: hypothetical protein IIA83_12375 [Thaumarchaeota archaeon]|nr:hypothetical protein [Nitrososphaerota archaeon]
MAISTNCSLVDNLVGSLYPKMNNVHVIIKNPVNDTDSTKRCQNDKRYTNRKNETKIDERKNETKIDERKNETKIDERKNETKIENRNVNTVVLGCGIELTGGVKQTAC